MLFYLIGSAMVFGNSESTEILWLSLGSTILKHSNPEIIANTKPDPIINPFLVTYEGNNDNNNKSESCCPATAYEFITPIYTPICSNGTVRHITAKGIELKNKEETPSGDRIANRVHFSLTKNRHAKEMAAINCDSPYELFIPKQLTIEFCAGPKSSTKQFDAAITNIPNATPSLYLLSGGLDFPPKTSVPK